mmetsp:Transcript_11157/g.27298  ORF Transcript_11157/g.27298 Transcript_11157/m.27298 type:complete len:222 (+) Transcript_11157:1292-1957(+)
MHRVPGRGRGSSRGRYIGGRGCGRRLLPAIRSGRAVGPEAEIRLVGVEADVEVVTGVQLAFHIQFELGGGLGLRADFVILRLVGKRAAVIVGIPVGSDPKTAAGVLREHQEIGAFHPPAEADSEPEPFSREQVWLLDEQGEGEHAVVWGVRGVHFVEQHVVLEVGGEFHTARHPAHHLQILALVRRRRRHCRRYQQGHRRHHREKRHAEREGKAHRCSHSS